MKYTAKQVLDAAHKIKRGSWPGEDADMFYGMLETYAADLDAREGQEPKAWLAEQLKDSGTADFVTSTRNGVVRTEPGRCKPNTKYALIPMPPNT